MLQPNLLKAYQQTNYCFNDVVLNIGKVSIKASVILDKFIPNGGLFITAWNPLGKELSHDENEEANSRLENELTTMGLTVIKGYGVSPDDQWREDSFFAYPISEDASLDLCNKYLQNAVVYVTSEGLPVLLLSND